MQKLEPLEGERYMGRDAQGTKGGRVSAIAGMVKADIRKCYVTLT